MQLDPDRARLPATITRPLWSAAIGLLGFTVALAIWAGYAPIATTIRLSGSFASSRPSYDLQHPYGGKIAKVFVVLHQSVARGDPLFLIDVRTQLQTLVEIEIQRDAIKRENRIISRYLTPSSSEITFDVDAEFLELQYREVALALQSKIKTRKNATLSARERLKTVHRGIGLLQERRQILIERAQEKQRLVVLGIVRKQEKDILTDTILSLGSDLQEQRALAIALLSEAEQSDLTAKILRSDYRHTLVARLNGNQQRLPDLRRQIARLKAETDSAVVRSPIAGTVVVLKFDSAQMYAGKGQTLVTLAQNLDNPMLHLIVPISAIDQVHTGMSGLLTVPALPQREMPKIRLTLTSLSPEAQKDREGVSIHYLALASINQTDLKNAKRSLGDRFRLATDMPVSVSLEGRKTTMATYLFGTFANLFTDALQD